MMLLAATMEKAVHSETVHTNLREVMHSVIPVLAQFVGLVGVVIMMVGLFRMCILWLRYELRRCKPTYDIQELKDKNSLREHLGFYIVLGLEVLIIADVLETIAEPTWQHLMILASVVVLRTVISFALNYELKEIREEAANRNDCDSSYMEAAA